MHSKNQRDDVLINSHKAKPITLSNSSKLTNSEVQSLKSLAIDRGRLMMKALAKS